MVAGSAVHEALASQASAPTTTGFSVNRLRNQVKEASCRQVRQAGGAGEARWSTDREAGQR